MRQYASDIAFTTAVKKVQESKGSRHAYARMERGRGWRTSVTAELKEFLSQLDMFYLATANGVGQPYIQYRGGPAGFLQAMDSKTLAFADFGGNQQFITLGNLSENPRAFIFLMDYANRRRIKIWGTAKVIEGDAELIERLSTPDYPARVERAIVFIVEAWDVNCPQHIHPRWSKDQLEPVLNQLCHSRCTKQTCTDRAR
jgi:predicted pyridoxine 5'-phosphate oxidase superfamily flavin-nucleotide-binding protein